MENNNDILLSLFLLDQEDKKKYIKTLYVLSNDIFGNYRTFKIKKRNNKYRTVYEPKYLLKQVQRRILKNVLEKQSVSEVAMAYCKGRSLRDNAIRHVMQKQILKIDIKSFFDSINFLTVYTKCFAPYYPKNVAYLLTNLCMYGDILPQGAPTSSYISNIVMKDFDLEVIGFCKDRNINYSRYSDDLTFSGDFDSKEVIVFVKSLLRKMGLEINKNKVALVKGNRAQKVTGVVVNEKVNVERSYRMKIRQEVYYIKKYGLDNHLRKKNIVDKEEYLRSLLGRINYSLQINPNDTAMKQYCYYVKKLLNS